MRLSRRTVGSCSLAFMLASCSFAHAADHQAAPVETWTGFSLGVGGGIGILNANLNQSASRTDGVGCGTNSRDCPQGVILRGADQGSNSRSNDLSGTGGLFTLQGAYDYQFAPHWLVGGFVDADWSDISADAHQTFGSSITFICPSVDCNDQPDGSFSTSNGKIHTKVSTDWTISVGGRIGWLANSNTLLYFLGAYTHAELGDAKIQTSIPDPSGLIGVVLGGSPGSKSFS